MRKSVLLDTGFWIALFDESDEHHDSAISVFDLVKDENMLIPWPTLYEFMNTGFTKSKLRIDKTKRFIENDPTRIQWIDDATYRESALEQFLTNRGKKFSLVDLVIRAILSDINIRIDYLITFNAPDFEDVCQRRGVTLLS